MAEQIFYGYFESTEPGAKPEYDPPRNAPCPFCGKPIIPNDVQTPSLMYAGESYAKRSYFYRQHKSCAEKFAPLNMDDFILEMIARNGD